MLFCDVCGNMVYMSIRSEASESGTGDVGVATPQLRCICKSCGFTSTAGAGQCSSAVFTANYGDDQNTYKQYMSRHIKDDPTLPHTEDIACINEKCSRAEGQKRDVIFVKYDAKRLRYLYHCVHCREFWKSGGN
jgi:hypothetical protein